MTEETPGVEETALPKIRELPQIQEVCSRLTEHVVDQTPGVNQADLDWLRQTRKDYRALRNIYYLERNNKRLPKAKAEKLAEKGLTTSLVSEDEAVVASELLDALHATFDYINQTDPQMARDRERQGGVEYAKIATSANIEFADFFMKMHQRFNLNDEEMYTLFDTLFDKAGINRELEIKGLGHFPGGVLAVVKTYLHLNKQLPDWSIKLPNVDLDMHHSVDMIAESPDGAQTRYYEIKGRKDVPELSISEITKPQQLQQVEEQIQATASEKDLGKQQGSLRKLSDFIGKLRQKEGGQKARGYWVAVPSGA